MIKYSNFAYDAWVKRELKRSIKLGGQKYPLKLTTRKEEDQGSGRVQFYYVLISEQSHQKKKKNSEQQ